MYTGPSERLGKKVRLRSRTRKDAKKEVKEIYPLTLNQQNGQLKRNDA